MRTRDKMLQAQAHIQRKEYDQARKILNTVDHPKAKDWLVKLDKIAPKKRLSTRRKIALGCGGLVVLLILAFGLFIAWLNTPLDAVYLNVKLSSYCRQFNTHSLEACEAWDEQVLADPAMRPLVDDCYQRHPGFDALEADRFDGCLFANDIRP